MALNTLCVDIEDIGPNALQVPYPGPEGLEYVCINFTITDQSQSTEFDIDFFANNGDLDACPDSDWSTFAGGSADLPLNVLLPVELVSFDARTDGEDVLLAWETATETNNAGFEVQHTSAEATEPVRAGLVPAASWQPLVFVEGHGTSLDAHTYTHRVSGLEAGVHRFRLKQVDFDGAFAYSPEVEIEVGLPEGYRLSDVYPNPFNPQAAFTLAVAEEQAVRLEVFDVLGRSRLCCSTERWRPVKPTGLA